MPGIVTLKDLLDGVRGHLASWPIRTTLTAGIDASVKTLTVDDAEASEYVANRCLVEVDNEVMLALAINGPVITLLRGHEGSTPAAHNAGSTVYVHPPWGWSNRMLWWNHINDAIRWLKPAAWVIAKSENFYWESGSYDTQIPGSSFISHPHGNQVIQLEYQDSSGAFKPFYGWQMVGPYVRFSLPATERRTLHAIYAHYQRPLNGLSETLDNDDFKEAIECYAAHLALNSLKTNRVRFAEYSASLSDRSSTPDELIRLAFDLKNQAVLAKENAMRQIPAGYLSTYRDPQ